MDKIDVLLARVLTDSGQGIQLIDPAGKILYANQTIAQMSGFDSLEEYLSSQDQFNGSRITDEKGYPFSLEGLPSRQVLKDHQAHSAILHLQRAGSQDGLSVLVQARPIFDSSGNLECTITTMDDLTERLRSEGKSKQYAMRTEMLVQFSQAVAEAGLEYPEIITTIANSIHQLTGDITLIHIRSSNGQWLDPIVGSRTDQKFTEIVSAAVGVLNQNPGIETDETCGKGQDKTISDLSEEGRDHSGCSRLTPLLDQFPVSSTLALPLCLHSQVFGWVFLIRLNPLAEYTEEEREILQDLVDRAALAIENARLYVTERQRARELNALHQATRALLTTIDLDMLLGQILDAAMTAIPAAEKGELHLIAKDTGRLEMRAALGYRDTRIKSLSTSKIQWYTAKAIHERQSLLINDSSSTPESLPEEAVPEVANIKSIVIAPLILNEEVLGALTLSSNKISAFTESNRNLLASFADTTTEALHNAQLHAEVQKLAITDPLTNMYNRRGFFEIGRREIQRARRFKHPLSAIMLDIDHFKAINDNFGHGIGDRVLVSLAISLHNSIRSVDILGRYGGDEFVILLPETDLFTASSVAERLRQCATEMQVVTDRGVATITISLGISKAVADTQDLTSLIENADTALYFAKQHGRNRIEIN